ncbi:putative glutamate--tRNA ligase [Leptospira yanagawae serovar Saopaulo str. Sao Paulo = ATCC 700523]|uniref:Glutamate--tRNA ligase n=1 Tax=Leptospira yanagawae serovar Saopaulo str. Sao Paulo = ATCC 700523 TaxID=1249483 RepID=A0A5E8HFU8_9LEPT|nr:glutamate--tRNA ligase [Leptospira yanagawae]EOQ88856.1 putative glutamate--tRNA ligase [Leptospira yanagawae serovar Saopaulo str. Sao Paulo = ATCC 700523]
MTEVRTRFAPSPSGFLHVGGARTALFNYLYAKAKKGKFLLRIEDTDQDRSTEASFKIILESLKWLGMEWDEGPGVGGPNGPYTQSERIHIYKEYTDKLLKEKKAYRCFCTAEELEGKKKQADAMGIPYIYDGKCSDLSDEEINSQLEKKTPFTVRFKTPHKIVIVDDMIQGKVKFESKLIGDFIIVKSDGFPSYNYAVVIDDALMKITHVIRGVGHLSNTPRQILIFEAFGFPLPRFAHASEIVGTDGKKLSKRAGATSVLAFRDLGYSSETMRNYMALLGWTSPDGKEYMSDEELCSVFDVERCSKSPATFDVFKKLKEEEKESVDFNKLTILGLAEYLNPKSKLNWMSNKYIRDTKIETLGKALEPFLKDCQIPEAYKSGENPQLLSILDSVRVYLDRLIQAPPYIEEFFLENVSFENEEAKQLVLEGKGKEVVSAFYQIVKTSSLTSPDAYKEAMAKVGESTGEKGRTLFMPIRAITTGKSHGLELPILFSLLGQEKMVKRMEQLAGTLGISLR